MGGTQRLAAVAAMSHARRYYNHTQPEVTPTEASPYTLNILFASATLCGVLVMVCAACWRRTPTSDKPDDVAECHGVYTVSADSRLSQCVGMMGVWRPHTGKHSAPLPKKIGKIQVELPGPPPAYETVIEGASADHSTDVLQEVATEKCPQCHTSSQRCDSGLPSYEAAVLLKDSKL